MSVRRIVGMETEFGIVDAHDPRANLFALCAHIVQAYGETGSASGLNDDPVAWDYSGETPLNDARGYKMRRADAHPSLLTDDPDHPAPSGDSSVSTSHLAPSSASSATALPPLSSPLAVTDSPGASRATVCAAPVIPSGHIYRMSTVRRPSEAEKKLPKAPNVVLTNGARFYVDHAHPEYSAPEVSTPREAVLWDRAGELIAREAMAITAHQGVHAVLYKNNLDGKGSAYGTHENYLLNRAVDFHDVIRVLTPFFTTRPIICGAGRVGIGQRSENPGFQISARADYIENDIGIETTFNRPIINTRDEPHADEAHWRRLHVINGDANQFDVSNLLKVGTTSAVLWLLEHWQRSGMSDRARELVEAAIIAEPVSAQQIVSHDPSLRATVAMADGTEKTALDIQQIYLDLVRCEHETEGGMDPETAEVLAIWQEVLDGLRTNIWSVARRVEWVAKAQMLESMRARGDLSWADNKLRAFDLQWHDLRPERSIVNRLDQAGRIERVVTTDDVLRAVTTAPETTRAYLRGGLIEKFPGAVVAAAWESITLDVPGLPDLVRVPLLSPNSSTRACVGHVLDSSNSAQEFVENLLSLAPAE